MGSEMTGKTAWNMIGNHFRFFGRLPAFKILFLLTHPGAKSDGGQLASTFAEAGQSVRYVAHTREASSHCANGIPVA